MNDLEERLRDHLARRASRAQPSPDAWRRIAERIDPEAAPRPWWRPSAPRLAVALAGVALVAVAAFGSQQLLSDDPVVEIETIAPDLETGEPDTSAGWQLVDGRFDPPATIGPWSVNDAMADEALILVVADDGNLWRSVDGGDGFERLDAEMFTDDDGQPADLQAVVDVGHVYLVAGGTPSDGTVWRSTDGLAFEAVDVPGARDLSDLSAAEGRVVAVGRDDAGAAAFLSDDAGATWRTADLDPRAEDDRGLAVVTHGPYGWVAAGARDDELSRATMWSSADGREWELVETLGIGAVSEVIADGAGYHLLRADGRVMPSADGREWVATHVNVKGSGFEYDDPRDLRMAGLLRHDGGWLVVGGVSGLEEPPHAFTSEDGLRWSAEPLDDDGEVDAVVRLPDGTTVAIGRGDACWDRAPCPAHEHALRVWRR